MQLLIELPEEMHEPLAQKLLRRSPEDANQLALPISPLLWAVHYKYARAVL